MLAFDLTLYNMLCQSEGLSLERDEIARILGRSVTSLRPE